MHQEADACHDLGAKVDFAINSIRKFANEHAYVGVSWGKDSVVVAYLAWIAARHLPLMHLRPTNHNPDCDRVRDLYFKRFPGQEYHEIKVDYSAIDRLAKPDHELDAETDSVWYQSIREWTSSTRQKRILGIRGDESTGRLIRMLRWGIETKNALAPIGFWKTQDVFSCLEQHSLPVHPAYAMLGGGRWARDRIRVAEIGDTNGKGNGRRQWEQEYYGDVLNRMEATKGNW
jgi:phosphoadenosine phosphosulfate reductase